MSWKTFYINKFELSRLLIILMNLLKTKNSIQNRLEIIWNNLCNFLNIQNLFCYFLAQQVKLFIT